MVSITMVDWLKAYNYGLPWRHTPIMADATVDDPRPGPMLVSNAGCFQTTVMVNAHGEEH